MLRRLHCTAQISGTEGQLQRARAARSAKRKKEKKKRKKKKQKQEARWHMSQMFLNMAGGVAPLAAPFAPNMYMQPPAKAALACQALGTQIFINIDN